MVGRLVGIAAPQLYGAALVGETTIDGKTILLHAEQGFGDTIQFVRYAALAAGRGAATIILEVQRELVPLLAGIAGVAAVVARGEPLPGFDLHCPLLSLPLAFATELATIPAPIPYLTTPQARVAPGGAGCRRRPLIGLVWSGNRNHDNDLNRSIGLATLAPLLDLPNVAFVSLQHDIPERDLPVLQKLPNLYRIDTSSAILPIPPRRSH